MIKKLLPWIATFLLLASPVLGAEGDPIIEGKAVSSLTASKPLFTDGDKKLSSSGTVPIDQGGTGQTTAANAFGALKQAATASATGVVELATSAEVATGTDTTRAVTPAGLAAINQYKTLYIPAGSFLSATTNGATWGQSEKGTNDNDYGYYAFDDTTEEYIHIQIPMPENWDRSTIKAKFFWSSASGSSIADTVEWQIAGQAISNDDALDVAMGDAGEVISDAVLAADGGDLQLSGATPAVTVGGTPALADLIHFEVSRNVGGTDDMAEDAWLFGVWIQYQVNNSVSAW